MRGGFLLWLLLFLLAVPALAGPKAVVKKAPLPPRLDRLDAGQLTETLRKRPEETFGERLERISTLAVGIPYKIDPLGEGPNGVVDQDPLFRLDRFDCLTFVETVWALAGTESAGEAQALLQRMRYAGGEIRYAKRNHFTWPQWLVNNEKAGFIKPLGREVAGDKVRTETKTYKPVDRYPSRWKNFLSQVDGYPFPDTTHEVVPLEVAIRKAKEFPTPCLVAIVTKDQSWSPVRIRHVGLVVRQGGKTLLRHASRVHGRVVDVSLVGYLQQARTAEKAPIVGIIPVQFLEGPSEDKILQSPPLPHTDSPHTP